MKTNSRNVLGVWTALCCLTATAAAASLPAATSALLGAASTGQAASSDGSRGGNDWLKLPLGLGDGRGAASDPFAGRTPQASAASDAGRKSAASNYLRNGRLEMARGNLDAAKNWQAKAAALGVAFDPSEDSPQKLAADIQASGGGRAASGGFSQPALVNPYAENSQPVRTTSFQTETPGVIHNPFATAGDTSAASQGNAAAKSQSAALLKTARLALARGDVKRAAQLVEQSQSLTVQYDLTDDTPAKVDALVNKVASLADYGASARNTEGFRRLYAEILMDQSEGLLRWREYDEAERVANAAGGQRVAYGPFEATPAKLLDRIATARRADRQNGALAPVETPANLINPAAASAGAAGPSLEEAKAQVAALLLQARQALSQGDILRAEDIARQAADLGVPDSSFTPREDRPGLVLLEVQRAKTAADGQDSFDAAGQRPSPASPAAFLPLGHLGQTAQAQVEPRPSAPPSLTPVPGSNNPPDGVSAPEPRPAGVPGASDAPSPGTGEGSRLFAQAEQALRAGDLDAALSLFQQAAAHRDEFDPATFQRLQDHLQFLSASTAPRPAAPAEGSLLDNTAAQQQIMARQISAEIARLENESRQARQTDPGRAMRLLENARQMVDTSQLNPAERDQLLRRVDRGVAELNRYVEENRGHIDLAARNQQVLADRQRMAEMGVEVQEKIALMVNEFNTLMDDRSYMQAEIVAKKLAEIAPHEPVVQQVIAQSRITRRLFNEGRLADAHDEGFVGVAGAVDESGIPFDDRYPIVFPGPTEWKQLKGRREHFLEENRLYRSEREIEISRKLQTPIELSFNGAPLAEVMDYLKKMAQVPLHLDHAGLADAGITTDTPVTIDLSQPISLKSALHLILEPLDLRYVIEDEVLKITSEHMGDVKVYQKAYYVGDLVIPIPNFVPDPDMGLAGALKKALHDSRSAIGGGMGGGFGHPALSVAATSDQGLSGSVDPAVLANTGSPIPAGSGPGILGHGPGGMGGGVEPDFDSLIDLIIETIAPESWVDVGGPGAIREFEANLTLVISQTQDVHEQIADLLDQLRRLQDLQVTIEVRFITLNDNFFERIGVDFDFDIDDDIDKPFQVFGEANDDADGQGSNPTRDTQDRDHGPGVTVGLDPQGNFTTDLDIPFQQGHFPLAQPQFGGFAPGAGATLGFAILSDIEARFLIEAAHGDRRSNILQAPKVTLFNGQTAFVSDTSLSPFVISVIPVVGDFAVAQQPVIVVLNEGTHLSVQAVVSSDRRFVRLTVVPFFSQIGDVDEFTFEGSTTSVTDTSSTGPDDGTTSRADARTVTTSGTTVQLPTFSFTSVTTTVSVPDGGTVLLGGIKRLSEGRNEFGVPLLSKVPYINRLFKNVGIGRETQSLMMMVTPRIIIQEEEEANLLGPPAP